MGQAPSDFPKPLPELRKPRNPLLRMLGQTYLRLAGWRVEGQFPVEPKCVLIVAHHTSNWDFMLGVAFLLAVDLRASWLGKHTIFKRPFEKFLRGIGGIPVNRSESQGLVGQCVKAFQDESALCLGLSPEGTRKGQSRWKSGFYQIAVGANVPIFPVAFDFGEHVLRLWPVFHPTGDMEADLKTLQALYAPIQGCKTRPSG